MLIDIFLLNVRKTHKSLNRFDNALGVSDQIMVRIRGREAIGESARMNGPYIRGCLSS